MNQLDENRPSADNQDRKSQSLKTTKADHQLALIVYCDLPNVA